MKLDDIKKLAALARVDMPEAEMIEIGQGFDAILAYVGQVQEIDLSEMVPSHTVSNVMRDDVATTTPGMYTEKILAEMPDTEAGFLKVKQIL